MEFDFYAIFLISFLSSTVQCNEFNKMSQISQDMEEILHTVNKTTITSCQMFCSREKKCNEIGLTKGSNEGPFNNCHLLLEKIVKPEMRFYGQQEVKNEIGMIKASKLVAAKPKPKSAIKWKRFTFVGCNERTIVPVKLMTMNKVTRQYKMDIEVMRTKFEDEDKIVVQFYHHDGARIPMVMFRHKTQELEVGMRFKRYFPCNSGFRYPLNRWIKVQAKTTEKR